MALTERYAGLGTRGAIGTLDLSLLTDCKTASYRGISAVTPRRNFALVLLGAERGNAVPNWDRVLPAPSVGRHCFRRAKGV